MVRRWSKPDSLELYEKFRVGELDPKQQDPKYIKEYFNKSVWLQGFTTLKRFYKNYRLHADIYLSENISDCCNFSSNYYY